MAVGGKLKGRTAHIVAQLRNDYPDAHCSLEHATPLELLVATILSAQCTDKRVNMVTPGLFKRFPTAAKYARARQATLEREIQSTGFFRSKAKNIKQCCRMLEREHAGEIPSDLEALVKLPGVGRKTANVVLGTAYGIASGVVVDTHVGRLSRRLRLTKEKDPVKIERDLMRQLPSDEWVSFSHRMILHGRRVCTARRPKCDECFLARWCPRIGVA